MNGYRYYGTAVAQPTGYGLPGYDDSVFSLAAALPGYDDSVFSLAAALPDLADDDWCERAGCPKRDCVACKQAARA